MVAVVVEGHDLHVGVISTDDGTEVIADEIRLGMGRGRESVVVVVVGGDVGMRGRVSKQRRETCSTKITFPRT